MLISVGYSNVSDFGTITSPKLAMSNCKDFRILPNRAIISIRAPYKFNIDTYTKHYKNYEQNIPANIPIIAKYAPIILENIQYTLIDVYCVVIYT